MADALMSDANTDALLDRCYDVKEKLVDCGLAPAELDEASLLAGAPACAALRATAASLAAALTALSRRLAAAAPGCAWDGEAAAAAAGRLHTACADEALCADGALERALVALLRALDPAAVSADRVELLDALVARLQAARMVIAAAPAADEAAAAGAEAGAAPPAVPLAPEEARRVSSALRETLSSLCAPACAAASAARDGPALARAAAAAASALAATLPAGFLDPLLPRGALSESQLAVLTAINEALGEEYSMRRAMLVHRADCTLASLLTSARTSHAATRAEAERCVAPERGGMVAAEGGVACDEAFDVCKADLASLARKTSCKEERHASASVKRVLIGDVPDRGGRTEGRADPSMPRWAPRAEGAEPRPARGGGRGGGGGGGGGGGRRGGGRGRGGEAAAAAAPAPAAAAAAAPADGKRSVAWKPKPKAQP